MFTSILAAQPPTKFEVASVKPVAVRGGGTCPESLKIDGGFVYVKCATLPMLIGYAFRISPGRVKRIEGRASRFDIAATIPPDASPRQVPDMVQALLSDRFHLTTHLGVSREPVYALVVAKGGLRVKKAASSDVDLDPDIETTGVSFYGDIITRGSTLLGNARMGTVKQTDGPDRHQRWDAPNISFAGLADLLDKVTPLTLPILDMTGLKGRYELVLEVSLNDSIGSPAARIGAARDPASAAGADDKRMEMEESVLREFNVGLRKLGLQLERRRGMVETLIVDRVDSMPAGN